MAGRNTHTETNRRHSEQLSIDDPSHLTEPPDGGRQAWLSVLGSFLALSSTFGVVNAFGVFQSYYTSNLLNNSSSTTISFIGALQLAILYGAGPVIGKIFDAHGLRVLFPLGSFLCVFSLMMLSLCKQNQPYQFFLTQGLLFGIGNAMIFTPALAVMGHWFKARRAYVLGIVGAGSSLGGVVFPIMLQRLIPEVGFPWAVRITGFVQLACLIVAGFTMKTRLPLKRKIVLLEIIDLGGFRDIRYILTAIGSFLYFYALFIPYFFIEDYGKYRGVDSRLSGYLLSILNAMGIPARIIPGLLADKVGVLPILVPSSVISGITVLALWLPARGTVPIVLFSAFYGLFSGAYVSLLPAYVATITPVEKFGARLGSIYPFVALACLVGSPTGGAFVPTFTQANFNRLIIFTGILLLAGACSLGLAGLFTGRRKVTTHPNEKERTSSVPSDRTSPVSTPEEA